MTVKEVAEKTGLAEVTVRVWSPKLNVAKTNGAYDWTEADIEKLVNRDSRKKWNDEYAKQAKEMLDKGLGFTAISKELKVHRSRLYRGLVSSGILTEEELKKIADDNSKKSLKSHTNRITDEQKKQIDELYKKTHNKLEIQRQTGVSYNSIVKYLKSKED